MKLPFKLMGSVVSRIHGVTRGNESTEIPLDNGSSTSPPIELSARELTPQERSIPTTPPKVEAITIPEQRLDDITIDHNIYTEEPQVYPPPSMAPTTLLPPRSPTPGPLRPRAVSAPDIPSIITIPPSRQTSQTLTLCFHKPQPQPLNNNLPNSNSRRNLIVLMDGTANEHSSKPSNVVKLLQILQVDDDQAIYYGAGIGTLVPPALRSLGRFGKWSRMKWDQALATNFSEHVKNAYIFLMEHYHDGDKIYIFGYSRGGYAARCLVGMIEKIGLLPCGNIDQVPLAWKHYCDTKYDIREIGERISPMRNRYKQIFATKRSVNVHYLGVWDTVSSVKLFGGGVHPFSDSVSSVCFFRHALAINERRARFQPIYREDSILTILYVWGYRFPPLYWHDDKRNGPSGFRSRVNSKQYGSLRSDRTPNGDQSQSHAEGSRVTSENRQSCEVGGPQRSKEVWFVGGHSDCGGGGDEYFGDEQASLSNISFRWMVREAVYCGLKIDAAGFMDCPALTSVIRDDPSFQEVENHHGLRKLKYDIGHQNETKTQIATINQDQFAFDDNTAKLRNLHNELLPPHLLRSFINLAAERDTLTRPLSVNGESPITAMTSRHSTSTQHRAHDESTAALKSDLERPIKDKLKSGFFWSLVESTPYSKRVHKGDERERQRFWYRDYKGDYYAFERNLGRGRLMMSHQLVHRSVYRRLVADQDKHGEPFGAHKLQSSRMSKFLPPSSELSWDDLRNDSDGRLSIWEI